MSQREGKQACSCALESCLGWKHELRGDQRKNTRDAVLSPCTSSTTTSPCPPPPSLPVRLLPLSSATCSISIPRLRHCHNPFVRPLFTACPRAHVPTYQKGKEQACKSGEKETHGQLIMRCLHQGPASGHTRRPLRNTPSRESDPQLLSVLSPGCQCPGSGGRPPQWQPQQRSPGACAPQQGPGFACREAASSGPMGLSPAVAAEMTSRRALKTYALRALRTGTPQHCCCPAPIHGRMVALSLAGGGRVAGPRAPVAQAPWPCPCTAPCAGQREWTDLRSAGRGRHMCRVRSVLALKRMTLQCPKQGRGWRASAMASATRNSAWPWAREAFRAMWLVTDACSKASR